MKNQYTHIVDEEAEVDIWTCNDCGAFATEIRHIRHHSTCKPGESEKWKNLYSKEDKGDGRQENIHRA